ncbi:hypothetical protein RUM44_012128 [Polyplax serrata]|uniref:Uncharacterized protein n=1 Tax=Polyplax serrata TaxID=468196 RepID=A0ABR1BEH9_POLSC
MMMIPREVLVLPLINSENLPVFISETVNDLHHSSQLTETQGKIKEKQKVEQSNKLGQESRRRNRSKWHQSESKSREKHKMKEETLSSVTGQVGKTSEKNSNQCTGEKDAAVSLTCITVESGRVTPSATRSSDRFATKFGQNHHQHQNYNNNNNNTSLSNANDNYQSNNNRFKYYGFLDSGDENAGGNSRDEKIPVKMEPVNEYSRNRKSSATEKEIVYENVRIESSRVDKRVTSRSDQGRSPRNRLDERKANFEHLSRRYLEYNVRVGKYENKLNGFPVPETDLYGTGHVSGSCVEDYKGGLYDGFRYLESKYTYSVSGIPGNLAQSSTAAAFFAR